MVWIVLLGLLAAIFFTMGVDRLSHRLGYGSRGTWLAIGAMMVSGAAILFISLPTT